MLYPPVNRMYKTANINFLWRNNIQYAKTIAVTSIIKNHYTSNEYTFITKVFLICEVIVSCIKKGNKVRKTIGIKKENIQTDVNSY